MVAFGDVIEHLNTSSSNDVISDKKANDWVTFTMDTLNGQVTLNSNGNMFQTSCQVQDKKKLFESINLIVG